MARSVNTGKVESVIYAQLEPGEDLYVAIRELCKEHDIRAGLVLNIVGGLTRARLNLPVAKTGMEVPPGMKEWQAGVIECSGVGIIGQMHGTFDLEKTTGVLYRDGDPYIHVHMTIATPDETAMGHLVEGCIVRSVHPASHFTIALAKIGGIEFNCRVSDETSEHYPTGFLMHEVKPADADGFACEHP